MSATLLSVHSITSLVGAVEKTMAAIAEFAGEATTSNARSILLHQASEELTNQLWEAADNGHLDDGWSLLIPAIETGACYFEYERAGEFDITIFVDATPEICEFAKLKKHLDGREDKWGYRVEFAYGVGLGDL